MFLGKSGTIFLDCRALTSSRHRQLYRLMLHKKFVLNYLEVLWVSHCRANRAFYKYVQLLNRGQKEALLRTAIIYNSARNSLHPKFRDVSHTIPILQTTFLRSRRDRQPWLETDKVLKLSSDVLFLFYSMEFVSSRNSSPKLHEQGYFHLHPKITCFNIISWWYNLIYKKIEVKELVVNWINCN